MADITYAPYITRLAQLQLHHWWDNRPAVSDWFARICATRGYQQGLLAWNNENYLNLMAEKGQEIWSKFEELLRAVNKKNH